MDVTERHMSFPLEMHQWNSLSPGTSSDVKMNKGKFIRKKGQENMELDQKWGETCALTVSQSNTKGSSFPAQRRVAQHAQFKFRAGGADNLEV